MLFASDWECRALEKPEAIVDLGAMDSETKASGGVSGRCWLAGFSVAWEKESGGLSGDHHGSRASSSWESKNLWLVTITSLRLKCSQL